MSLTQTPSLIIVILLNLSWPLMEMRRKESTLLPARRNMAALHHCASLSTVCLEVKPRDPSSYWLRDWPLNGTKITVLPFTGSCRARIAFALLRATDLCIRGSRTKWIGLNMEDGACLNTTSNTDFHPIL